MSAAPPSMQPFYIDECLPLEFFLTHFGATKRPISALHVGAKDPEILQTAQKFGAVIFTADTWFLKELRRFPFGHSRCYFRAGVIQVPGDWGPAAIKLARNVAVIEAVCQQRFTVGNAGDSGDLRVAIDLAQLEMRIFDF